MELAEKKFMLRLGGTGDPAASRFADVPYQCEDVVQGLTVWLYRAGSAQPLGNGSLEVYRNGVSVSTTPFAGNSIFVPVLSANQLHPSTTSRRKVDAVYRYDPATSAMIVDKDITKFDVAPRNMDVYFKITNSDAVKKDLVLMWTGIIWRSF